MDEQLSTQTFFWLARPRVRFGARVIQHRERRTRWSPDEAARELHARRAELVGLARRRAETRGVPASAIEEIVSDAITAVVMAPRAIANQHHLIGAFWLAVEHRCRRYREGRGFARLGSRQRVEFDLALMRAPASDNPFDRLDASDRFARAADLMADLDDRERHVLATMASRGVGPVSAARLLGLPLGEVRAAARSAALKLDRVAAISAAGRMCEFRSRAVMADAEGRAGDEQARLARAHVAACVPCANAYRGIRRDMRRREFQRAAAAAFLPVPAIASGHAGIGRIAVWLEDRIALFPHGSGERAVELVAGGGVAKAAAAGTAVLLAGGALARPIVHAVESDSRPAHHARDASVRRAKAARTNIDTSASAGLARVHVPTSTASSSRTQPRRRNGLPTPPSRSLDYLALGGPSTTATHHESTAAVAHAASADARPVAESVPSKSGGGSGLQYLGR
jgi:DNA-directed RNA polymerase specialized sigma24 family protein